MVKSLTVLIILVVSQLIFLSLPHELIIPFNRLIRPTLYASVAIVYLIYTGREERPRPHEGQTLILAVIGSFLYISSVFVTGVIYGFGRNAMFGSNPQVFIENIWVYATVAFFSEYIRLKIIKDTFALTTLVYTFVQMDTLRNIFGVDLSGTLDFFFVVFFPTLTMNVVLSYMAFKSGFKALLIIRAIFGLSTVFLPVLPSCPPPVYAAVTSGVLLVFVSFYHINIISMKQNKRRKTSFKVSKKCGT